MTDTAPKRIEVRTKTTGILGISFYSPTYDIVEPGYHPVEIPTGGAVKVRQTDVGDILLDVCRPFEQRSRNGLHDEVVTGFVTKKSVPLKPEPQVTTTDDLNFFWGGHVKIEARFVK
jgi:hypothetical protein